MGDHDHSECLPAPNHFIDESQSYVGNIFFQHSKPGYISLQTLVGRNPEISGPGPMGMEW